MMNVVFKGSRQGGVALVLSLLILITMTIIGVSALSGTNMQERMAGNAYLQAQAFEAASAGVAQSLDFKEDNFPAGKTCNASTSGEWFHPADGFIETDSIGDATLMQRMYCLPFYVGDPASDPPAGYELFVLNRGIVASGEETIAQREVEVRIGRFGDDTSPCNSSPMCFPLRPDISLDPDCGEAGASNFCSCNFGKGKSSTNPFSGFNSNDFRVVGQELGDLGHGTAVSLSPNLEKAFECEVTGGSTEEQCDANGNKGTCSRLGNYVGGTVGTDEFGSPWNDPAEAYAFANELFMMSQDGASSIEYVTIGDAPVHQMSYSDSGEGILVVEGDLEWNGTPNFDGLIVVLGGTFNVSGGGQGGDGAGSVVVIDLEPKPSQGSGTDPIFGGDFTMEFSGGGTADYKFGCSELKSAWGGLTTDDAKELWTPECDETGGKPVDATDGIVSWRENIGWRSEDFAGSAL